MNTLPALFQAVCATLLLLPFSIPAQEKAWKMHTIDDSSRGADGIRLADVNGDGHLDMTTGWEEGGKVRVYLNPGPAKAKEKWPAVTVGNVRSPEDAVFVDLDGDGALDVVSSCEGRTKTVFVHWAPKDGKKYLRAEAWQTEAIPELKGKAQWMYCLPLQVDGKNGIDLVLGAKGRNAELGWLEAPKNPRDLSAWKWHPISPVGWVMSLRHTDIDGDGDQDIIVSDRKGSRRGARWLENPGAAPEQKKPWGSHWIGAKGQEVMFLDLADVNGNGSLDVMVPTYSRRLFFFERARKSPPAWTSHTLGYPEQCGTGKAVRMGDLNLDGRLDMVLTGRCPRGKHGIVWLESPKDPTQPNWSIRTISGPAVKKSYKPDRIELVDLDGDGDLDVITSEEQSLLGVIWYENPHKQPRYPSERSNP